MSDQKTNRPTIHDVAREAGVSAQTVSRAINNRPRISEQTRAHVLQVAKKLNYQPNKTAQALVTQRSHLIEIITTHPEHSLFKQTLTTMSTIIRETGYRNALSITAPDDFYTRVKDITAQLVDGVIFIVPNQNLRLSDVELSELCGNVPFVQISADLGSNSSVIYNQGHGVKLAVQHLIDLGHRHIAHIPGDPKMLDTHIRQNAWLNTLKENNIEPGPNIGGKFTVDGGYHATKELLETQFPFTAIFAANDRLAMGAIYAINEYGLSVPEDISIVGYDNIEYSPYSNPPLTTVHQDFQKLGKLAIEYLISLIEDPQTPAHQRVLLPELVIRQSASKPKK